MDRTTHPHQRLAAACGVTAAGGLVFAALGLTGPGTCQGTPVETVTAPLAFSLADAAAHDATGTLMPALAAGTALVLAALTAAHLRRRQGAAATLRTSR